MLPRYQAVQLDVKLFLPHNHPAFGSLLGGWTRQLAHKTVLETLFYQRAVEAMYHQVWACLAQTASSAADLPLELVVEECVRVVKGLVAARAGETCSLARAAWVRLHV